MKSKAKGVGRARKIIGRVFTSFLILSFLFVLSLYFFMKSTYPAPLITYAIQRATGMDVEIRDLTTGPWLRFTMNGLKIGRGRETLLYADRLELVIDLKGLTSGRVVSLGVVKPVIFLSALASPTPSGGEDSAKGDVPLLSIPWFFNELTIKQGLVRQGGARSPLLVGPLDLHVTARYGNRVGLKAKAYLPHLKTSASINAEVDMEELGLQKGHVSLGLIKLEDMDAGGLAIIRGGRGAVKADFTLERRDLRLRAAMKLEFKDITLPVLSALGRTSGRLTGSVALNKAFTEAELRAGLLLKEPGAGRAAYRAVLINGAYDIKQKELKITKADLTIPSLGNLHLIGTFYGLPDRLASIDINLKAERVSLALLNETFLRPLSIDISGRESGHGLSGRASVKGLVSEGLAWDMDFTLANSIRYGSYVLNFKDNPLKVSSKGVYSLSDETLKIGALRIEPGSAGSLTLKGGLKDIASWNPEMDLMLRGSAIDLAKAAMVISGPQVSDIALRGSLSTALSIKGRLDSPRIRGKSTLESVALRQGDLALSGVEASLAFGYDKAGFSMESVLVSSASMVMNGPGPTPKLLKTGISVRSITYDGGGLRAGDISLKADKAFLVRSDAMGRKGNKARAGPLPRLLRTGLTIGSIIYDGKLLRAEGLNLKVNKIFFESSGPKGGKEVTTRGGPLPKLLKTGLTIGSVTYDGKLVRAWGLNLKINKAIFLKEGRPYFEEQDIILSGAITGDISTSRFKAGRLAFTAGKEATGLGLIKGEASGVTLDLKGPIRAGASIALHDLSLERLRALAAELRGIGTGVEASGLLETGLTLDMVVGDDETSIKAAIKFGLKDGAFASADGSIAGEGLRLKAEGDLDLRLPSMKAVFSMKATARDFELLAGSFYGSFKDRPIEMSARGSYDLDKDELTIPALALSLEPLGRLKGAAIVSTLSTEPRFGATIGPVDISNSQLFDLFLRDTLSETMPLLESLDVVGRTGLTMRVDGTLKDLALRGELELRDAGVREKDGAYFVKGLELRLPIELRYPEAIGKGRRGGNKVKTFGSLKIEELSLGPVSISGLKASPAIGGNALVFGEDIVIPLFGGTLTLGDIVYDDLLSRNRELALQMEIADIDLKRASAAIGLPPFGGTLSGGIPGIRLAAGNLTTEGEIKLKLFGGELKLTHMAVGQVFSPVPSFKSSIEIREINLGKLTSAFEFGSITGVLQGRIDDLVLVKGQPESFFVDLRTVRRPGVSQRINTKALENVSILGTGAAASVLNRGIYRLFDEYRYAKLGFQGQLKNDELLLLGIETEGDKGYIIKGAKFPPKVNVVSYTQRISFKEMMKRLNRVDLSASGDAVIK